MDCTTNFSVGRLNIGNIGATLQGTHRGRATRLWAICVQCVCRCIAFQRQRCLAEVSPAAAYPLVGRRSSCAWLRRRRKWRGWPFLPPACPARSRRWRSSFRFIGWRERSDKCRNYLLSSASSSPASDSLASPAPGCPAARRMLRISRSSLLPSVF